MLCKYAVQRILYMDLTLINELLPLFKLKFFLMKGKVLKRKNSFSGTSGVISLGSNTYKKIKNIFLSGLEHHVAFTYGDVFEDIKSLGKKLNIPTYTI